MKSREISEAVSHTQVDSVMQDYKRFQDEYFDWEDRALVLLKNILSTFGTVKFRIADTLHSVEVDTDIDSTGATTILSECVRLIDGGIVVSGRCIEHNIYIKDAPYLDGYQFLLEDVASRLDLDGWYIGEVDSESVYNNANNN